MSQDPKPKTQNPRPEVSNNISVVLVDTLQPGNLGSVARAMKNMGLKQLKLVRPCDIHSQECQKMAVGAYHMVQEAQVFPTLSEALAKEHVIVATTSARGRTRKQRLLTPREIAPIVNRYAANQKVSLVFGSERRGLNDKQLALCQYLVRIPTEPIFPTLNLAQAVLILAYEVFNETSAQEPESPALVTEAERQEMFEHMEKVLTSIGFLSQSNPGHIMRSIRRFLGQAELTERDVQIVRGIMSQMDWYVREGRIMEPEEVKKP